MSYLVLARKYRPMFFQDVVGQKHVTQTLINAIEQNRIANAYLFSGPRGVGKTTVARLLAKALNCETGPTTNPCNKCSFCVEINESRSLDVLEIDGASNRGIDEVRNLRESLRYSPSPGKYRIYIIDEVHMLTNEAFNALLKTLEEPPPQVLFIFATTEAHKVLATILSRCQRFDFKRLSNKNIIEQVRLLCEKEDIEIDNESLRIIASKADGGMRDAQSTLDQIIAYCGNKINAEEVERLLGIINQDLFFKMTDLIRGNDVQGGIQLASQIFVEGYDFKEFLIGLTDHYRNFLVAKTVGATEELNVSEEHTKRYVTESHDFEVEDLLRLIKIASDTENVIRRSSNARIHLEVSLIKMIQMSKSVQLSQLLGQIDELKKKPSPVESPPVKAHPFQTNDFRSKLLETSTSPKVNQKQSSSPESPKSDKGEESSSQTKKVDIDLKQIESRWQELLEYIKKKKIALGSFLSEGWPTELDGDTIVITFGANNGFHISSIEKNREFFCETFKKVFGVSLNFKCVKDTEGSLDKIRKFPARVDKKREFENLKTENNSVQSIVDKFDAELVK